jgi:hypothetical protein
VRQACRRARCYAWNLYSRGGESPIIGDDDVLSLYTESLADQAANPLPHDRRSSHLVDQSCATSIRVVKSVQVLEQEVRWIILLLFDTC